MSCLSIKIALAKALRMTTSLLSAPMVAHAQLGNPPLRMSTRIVCGLPDYYLIVKPDVVWLTEANDWSHYFDVKSNVDWVIDVGTSEDDKDIVSMLFNELMIDNNTLLINGDTPSLILKMLHNGQMLTNKHYLKN